MRQTAARSLGRRVMWSDFSFVERAWSGEPGPGPPRRPGSEWVTDYELLVLADQDVGLDVLHIEVAGDRDLRAVVDGGVRRLTTGQRQHAGASSQRVRRVVALDRGRRRTVRLGRVDGQIRVREREQTRIAGLEQTRARDLQVARLLGVRRVRHQAGCQRNARGLPVAVQDLLAERRLGDAQLPAADGRRDLQVARQVDTCQVVLYAAGPGLTALERRARPVPAIYQRVVVGVDLADDRVDLRLQADGDIDAIALARDLPEQVGLAAALADDDLLRALRAIAIKRSGLIDGGARRDDREAQRVGTQDNVLVRGRRARVLSRIRTRGCARERVRAHAHVVVVTRDIRQLDVARVVDPSRLRRRGTDQAEVDATSCGDCSSLIPQGRGRDVRVQR